MNITAEDHISLEHVVLVIAFSGLIIIWHGHSFVQRLMTFSWFLSALLKKKKREKTKQLLLSYCFLIAFQRLSW